MKHKILTSFLAGLLFFLQGFSQVKLNSFATAEATIYLDFDGEIVNSPVWNNGNELNCSNPSLSTEEITAIFNRVAEDYRPFNINITTDINVFVAAPVDKRIRVIITPTSNWFTGVGGVAYTGSFTWGDDTPCFVFSDRLGNNNVKMIAECCSHESGHTLGLSHQSKYDGGCNLTATYNEGSGSGETGWAPIMGNSYYRNMSGWNNGPTPSGCNSVQDNLSIITTRNGFGYRQDDYSNLADETAFFISASNIDVAGVISTNTDKDAFTFDLTRTSNFHLDAVPFGFGATNEGADLDIRLSLYNAAKNLVRVYDPEGTMSADIDTVLEAGKYYLVVDGTGNNNAPDYGSLGSYTLKGNFGVLPLCAITLTGTVSNNHHHLGWNINCNEIISSTVLEASTDGINFTAIAAISAGEREYDYQPQQAAALYYRIRVSTLSGNTTYSSTVILKKVEFTPVFVVGNLVQNNLQITATGAYSYLLCNSNGACVARGTGVAGTRTTDISTLSTGMYILKLSGCGVQQTTRVLKQ